MNRRVYKIKWQQYHAAYTKQGFRLFRKSLMQSLSKIPWENIDENNFGFMISNYITNQPIIDAYEEFYTVIGLRHGRRVGSSINKEIKLFNPLDFSSTFRKFIRSWILSNSGQKITSVRSSLVDTIIEVFADGFSNNNSVQEISRRIRNSIGRGNIYRWQTMRIARTEATGAANIGAARAAEDSGVELVKEWISFIDSETRRRPQHDFDHVEMDGVTVDEKEEFNVNGDFIQFPADPKGEAGNIINCRCTIAYLVKRDSEGRIIFKS